jgi:hypothetical protein
MRKAYNILLGKPEGKRLHGRLKRRQDNIKIDLGKQNWWVWI